MSRFSVESLQAASKALAQKDASLWGAQALPTALERMGWIDLPENSRTLLPALDALAAWSRSVNRTRFVLSGMGGSSLAPEVIAKTFESELIILDSTHPDDVRLALDEDPSHTVFIISSKSGETIETLSHLKAIVERLARAQLELSEHIVVISDPATSLVTWANQNNVRIFYGETTVGGRFSALSIFGLLPAALLGIDCATLLDDAADMKATLAESRPESLAIQLTKVIGEAQPFLNLPAEPLSDWIEQLVAESTGKTDKGIIPVISHNAEVHPVVRSALTLPLGAAFYLWEWTTALLGYAIEVNPFDQPDVARAKEATQESLSGAAPNNHEIIRYSAELLDQVNGLSKKMDTNSANPERYIALLSFLPMHEEAIRADMTSIRDGVARKVGKNVRVTLGFGPRYLHSTGQCHKGGPAIGLFVIITLDESNDYPIPGAAYTFKELLMAQANGDLRTLEALGKPVVHAHLTRAEISALSRALHATS